MAPILAVAEQFFVEQAWPYQKQESDGILQLGYQGQNGRWPCVAQAREDLGQFLFYAICPNYCPEERRPAMAEFLTRANYGLLIGNFEMDFRDGEIRFKASIDVQDDRFSPALCHHLVAAACFTLDRYLPGILKVMFAEGDPAEAVAEIEGFLVVTTADA